MPTFNVKSRKTGPLTTVAIEAENRDAAIAQAIERAGEGESIEVLQAVEAPADEAAPAAKR